MTESELDRYFLALGRVCLCFFLGNEFCTKNNCFFLGFICEKSETEIIFGRNVETVINYKCVFLKKCSCVFDNNQVLE